MIPAAISRILCLRTATFVRTRIHRATLAPVLEAAGVDRARLLLVTVPEVGSVKAVVRDAFHLNPRLTIIARARFRAQVAELRDLGVEQVVIPEIEAGLEMVRQVLAHYQIAPADILRFSDAVHYEVYQPTLEGHLPAEGVQVLEDLLRMARSAAVEWVTVPVNSPLAGRNLGESRLRSESGASVVAIRGDAVNPNPGSETVLKVGDLLGLFGSAEQRTAARALVEG